MLAVFVSGGKDSTATLLLALERFFTNEVLPIFTDTGFESIHTYEYLDYLERRLGIEIVRVRSRKYRDLLHLIEEKGMFPHVNQRFCTYHMKLLPAAEYLAERKDVGEVWIGLRADESKARSKRYGNFSPEDTYLYTEMAQSLPSNLKYKLRKVRTRLPIVNWTEKQVFEFLKKKGVKLNPLYLLGHKRVGCYPCLLGTLREWKSCWKTEEGRTNILRLLELEKRLRAVKGREKVRIKANYSGEELFKLLKREESQLELFEGACQLCRT